MKKHSLYLLTGRENVLAAQRLRLNAIQALPEVLDFTSAEAARAYQSGMERASAILGKEDEIWFMPEPLALKCLGKTAPAEAERAAPTLRVSVIFGQAAVSDIEEGLVSEDVIDGLNHFTFATEAEADAFLRGVDEATGWMEYFVPDEDELQKIATFDAKLKADKIRAKALKEAKAPFDPQTLAEFVSSYDRGQLSEEGYVRAAQLYVEDPDYALIAARLVDVGYTEDEEDEEEVAA